MTSPQQYNTRRRVYTHVTGVQTATADATYGFAHSSCSTASEFLSLKTQFTRSLDWKIDLVLSQMEFDSRSSFLYIGLFYAIKLYSVYKYIEAVNVRIEWSEFNVKVIFLNIGKIQNMNI